MRVHRYGPHLFHTNATGVFTWLQRFGGWTPYLHRVRAILPDGRFAPLPVNVDTIATVYGVVLTSKAEAAEFLRSVAVPIADPANAGEHLRSRIGDVLTDLFFRPYTRKMWGLELEEMNASVVKRLPIRFDSNDLVFSRTTGYQALPTDGYTVLFEKILNHPAIEVELSTDYVSQTWSGHMRTASTVWRSTSISTAGWASCRTGHCGFITERSRSGTSNRTACATTPTPAGSRARPGGTVCRDIWCRRPGAER